MTARSVIALASLLTVNLTAADGRVEHGDVRIVCPLTVGGSFEARTRSLQGSLADGFSVDLRTLDTGIGLRNDHLRNRYLEVGKGDGFDKAVVSDIGLPDIDLESFQGKTTFTGTLLLHGTRKMIAGQVQIRRSPSSVRVEASFPVKLADFGIAKPQYLGVGVRDTVEARVEFVAMPAGARR